ncbi:MAG: EamA family transporter [Polyangiaceae bacterium]|nr:EamA family transporter [Polyangiaceae bacterium]
MSVTKLASLPPILVSVALNAAAQLALKQAARASGMSAVDAASGYKVLVQVAQNLWTWAGLGAYALSVALWILVLSRVDVSYAYPMVSLGYVMAAGAGKLLWQEDVSLTRMLGIGIICVGVVLVSRS